MRSIIECNFCCLDNLFGTQTKIELRKYNFKDFKDFKKRILVATDLFGRGIDIERVNIVVNYDFPEARGGGVLFLGGRRGEKVRFSNVQKTRPKNRSKRAPSRRPPRTSTCTASAARAASAPRASPSPSSPPRRTRRSSRKCSRASR